MQAVSTTSAAGQPDWTQSNLKSSGVQNHSTGRHLCLQRDLNLINVSLFRTLNVNL